MRDYNPTKVEFGFARIHRMVNPDRMEWQR
jgi:hypothetical protein